MEFSSGRRERSLNQERDQEDQDHESTNQATSLIIEKEHMFDKVVTPSDVGKLNRLVIPKQHAEKYFPLDTSSNEKGLLLSFEDRSGKPWRFRYSYWNSSQSYVMTKGWSRFVKEKRLDAGDTISFGRGVGEAARDRLFIDWKRRPDRGQNPQHPFSSTISSSSSRSLSPWSYGYLTPSSIATSSMVYDHRQSYTYNVGSPSSGAGQYLLFRSAGALSQPPVQVGHVGGDPTVASPMVLESVPVVHGKATAKRVRLFGVNLDCPQDVVAENSHSTIPLLPLHLQLGRRTESLEPSSSSSPQDQPPSLDLDI